MTIDRVANDAALVLAVLGLVLGVAAAFRRSRRPPLPPGSPPGLDMAIAMICLGLSSVASLASVPPGQFGFTRAVATCLSAVLLLGTGGFAIARSRRRSRQVHQ